MGKARPWGDLIQNAQGNFRQRCRLRGKHKEEPVPAQQPCSPSPCWPMAKATQTTQILPSLALNWQIPEGSSGSCQEMPLEKPLYSDRGQWVWTSVSGGAQAVNKQDLGHTFIKISYLITLETEPHVFSVSEQNSLRDTEILQFHLKAHMFQTLSMNKLKFLGVWFF